jgi:hypothetical protein
MNAHEISENLISSMKSTSGQIREQIRQQSTTI